MIYNWNFDDWKKLLLPAKLRDKPRINDLLLAALEAVKSGYVLFMAFREATLYKLRWTSQTIYLEKLLNNRFNNDSPAFLDFANRLHPVGIYIANPANFNEMLFRWNSAENRHVAARYNQAELNLMPLNDVRRKYRFNESELNANLCFEVRVPLALFDVSDPANAVLLANMKAWIELYRIAGSRYEIVNY